MQMRSRFEESLERATLALRPTLAYWVHRHERVLHVGAGHHTPGASRVMVREWAVSRALWLSAGCLGCPA